jgi:anti-sigma regulatory factor (Ser/Thr protein kinase)
MHGDCKTYMVLCSHVGSTWAVRIPELDREASAARLSQVEAVARALVATYGLDDSGGVDFSVELMPDALSAALAAAATARERAVRSPVPEMVTRRRLARQLYVEGLEVADIAAALGVSRHRVQLLVSDCPQPAQPTVTSAAPPAAAATSVLAPPARGGGVGLGAPPAISRESPVSASLLHREGADPPADHHYRHEALFYRGDDEFLAGTVPFIEDGLDLGHGVMVAVPQPRLAPLRKALGSRAADVKLLDMSRLGANPARIIPAWQHFIDEQGRQGRPLRGIGEPVWPGRRPAERAECRLHEALLNLAFDPGTPLWLRCPYDVDQLGTAETELAEQSHPVLVEDSVSCQSPGYLGTASGAAVMGTDLPAPPVTAQVLQFGQGNVRDVRQAVIGHAIDAGLGPVRTDDLTLAVWELAVNSVQHGGGEGVLRIWQEPGALICEVRDSGYIDDSLAGRRTPAIAASGQRGMWLVNQLCDLVQLRSNADGTTVRISSWL